MEQMEQVVFRRGVGRPKGSYKLDATPETIYRRRYYQRNQQLRAAKREEERDCIDNDAKDSVASDDNEKEEEEMLRQQYIFLGSKLRVSGEYCCFALCLHSC